MKLNKLLVVGLVVGLVAVLSAGFWVLGKIEAASFWPIVQFKNLSMMSPDVANIKNLIFEEPDGVFVVIDPSSSLALRTKFQSPPKTTKVALSIGVPLR